MKLIEVVNAREALGKLVVQDLPLKMAYRLTVLTNKCNFHLEFYGQEIAKCRSEEDVEELNNMEINDLHEAKLHLPIMDGLVLSASDVKALEPLVEFYEGE